MNHLRILVLLLCPLAWTNLASANPANKAALAKHFGPLLPPAVDGCILCHVAEQAGAAESLDEFPHNPFGKALRIAGEQLIDAGKSDAISDRIPLLADQDTDGDGVSNLDEILLGTRPGDRTDTPEVDDELPALRSQYNARVNAYPWRPFQPVTRPEVPSLPANWGRNSIDAFVAAKHLQFGLQREDEARPEHLLRRVYLDLIGLSPTPEQIESFVAEYADDPAAYDHAVDGLLEHPEYGVRWGRHWMDVWRYSDWAGYKDALRESQRHIWHWRDWIIESLNEDKGYDRMVMEMLAADELDLDADDLRATGYLARNFLTNRNQWMDNVVKHTSQAFMGVTLGCAKCHDHMTDPLMQKEYYAMRAIFEPYHVQTDRVPGELDVDGNGIPRAYDKSTSATTYLFEAGDERYPVKDEPIAPGVPASLGGRFGVETVKRSLASQLPDQRSFVVEALLAEARQQVTAADDELERSAADAKLTALQAELELEARCRNDLKKDSDTWKKAAKEVHRLQREAKLVAAQSAHHQAQTKLAAATAKRVAAEEENKSSSLAAAKKAEANARKAHQQAKDQLQNAKEQLDADLTTKFEAREQTRYPAQSSGRRLAFARWLTTRENPLTARVAVNHLWLRHFGRGLVPTPNDFGFGGREPTHPALLDWLAAELMHRDWSMKEIHRLIVTSDTYRLSSTINPISERIDPDNKLLWRAPIRRMEGEIVRDNLLWVGGRLDASHGGPDIDHYQAQTSRRRSVYLRHAHEKLVEFVQIFDGPSVSECYQRPRSIQPHQALALANSQLAVEAAKSISQQLQSEGLDETAFIERVFLRVLGRKPKAAETKTCLNFLAESENAKANLLLVLLNHNDFVAIR